MMFVFVCFRAFRSVAVGVAAGLVVVLAASSCAPSDQDLPEPAVVDTDLVESDDSAAPALVDAVPLVDDEPDPSPTVAPVPPADSTTDVPEPDRDGSVVDTVPVVTAPPTTVATLTTTEPTSTEAPVSTPAPAAVEPTPTTAPVSTSEPTTTVEPDTTESAQPVIEPVVVIEPAPTTAPVSLLELQQVMLQDLIQARSGAWYPQPDNVPSGLSQVPDVTIVDVSHQDAVWDENSSEVTFRWALHLSNGDTVERSWTPDPGYETSAWSPDRLTAGPAFTYDENWDWSFDPVYGPHFELSAGMARFAGNKYKASVGSYTPGPHPLPSNGYTNGRLFSYLIFLSMGPGASTESAMLGQRMRTVLWSMGMQEQRALLEELERNTDPPAGVYDVWNERNEYLIDFLQRRLPGRVGVQWTADGPVVVFEGLTD